MGANHSAATKVNEITFLTLNVLFQKDETRYMNIINFIVESKFMVVGLQEVTPFFHDMLTSNAKMTRLYDICYSPGRHDTALLILHLFKPKFTQVPLLHRINQDNGTSPSLRNITIGEIEIEKKKIGCATAHLESKFFTEKSTIAKCNQLKQLSEIMTNLNLDHSFVMGDMNLTGAATVDNFLQMENDGIQESGFIDMWLKLHLTDENQNTEDWRQNHCTWDCENNPLVPYREFHRPDRVFLMKNVSPHSIERVKGEPVYSDHYGLRGIIKLI